MAVVGTQRDRPPCLLSLPAMTILRPRCCDFVHVSSGTSGTSDTIFMNAVRTVRASLVRCGCRLGSTGVNLRRCHRRFDQRIATADAFGGARLTL
jgi:hypothetical protein